MFIIEINVFSIDFNDSKYKKNLRGKYTYHGTYWSNNFNFI